MILPMYKPIGDEESDRKYVIENIHNLVLSKLMLLVVMVC
jgi:hypothetical protein